VARRGKSNGNHLTEKAAKHINRYIERRGKGIGLRFGVRTTGCSGWPTSWNMWTKWPMRTCVRIARRQSVRRPKSLPYIDGTELDFAREGLNEGFKFNNPNVKDACGCGESFRI
jgi:iron-sulfur cluster assembly protein